MAANTTLMRPRGVVLALSLALLAPVGPPVIAAPVPVDGPYRVQMLYRTGTSLAPFRVTIQASSDNEYGMWFAIELYKTKGRWIERVGKGFGGYAAITGTPFPRAYGHPATAGLPTCPGQPGCTWPVSFDGSRAFMAEPTTTSRYYFVIAHANVKITADSKHWRLKDVPNPGFRRVFAEHTQATGASSTATVAEHFTSATAAGGRYGSAVFAYVPCERLAVYGTARLTARGATTDNFGLEPPHELQCYPDYQYVAEYAHTPYHTTWRLEGDVLGVGSGRDRLVVFDFPKP